MQGNRYNNSTYNRNRKIKKQIKKRKKIRRNRIMFFLLVIFIILGIFFITKYINKNKTSSPDNIYTKDGNLTESAKEEDIRYLLNELNENYPYTSISKKYTNIDTKNNQDSYISKLKDTENDEEYVNSLEKFLNEFKVSNLHLINKNEYNKYLKKLKNDLDLPYKDLILDKKTKDRYSKLEEYLDNREIPLLSMETPLDNTAYLRLPDFTEENKVEDKEKIKNFLDKVSNYSFLIMDIRGSTGDSLSYFIESLVEPLADRLYVSNNFILEKNNKYIDYLNYYTKYDYFILDNEDISFKKLPSNLELSDDKISEFNYFKKYTLKVFPNENNKFKGKIYILQDENTSNAADAFSQFANRTGFATTVGKTTKGGGINLSPAIIRLPNSGLLISMPIGMGLNENGTCNEDFGTFSEIKFNNSKNSLNVLLRILQ